MRAQPFFRPGGTLDPRAESYLRRKADDELLEALLAGDYVFVLDSRQKGKSSLVARAILRLRDEGVRTVKLDLQRIGANVTPEQWYAGLLAGVGDELGLREELLHYWKERRSVGPLARWVGAWIAVVLPAIAEPIVVFVDEVDFVRALPFSTDEFFAGIRDCYNRRAEDPAFNRLSFCLVGVATPAQLIRNPEVTPFNIGRRLELTDFTLAETQPYAAVLDAAGLDGPALMARVHHWVNGHPYLTQLLCSRLAEAPGADRAFVDRLVRETLLTPEARHREPNLADVERRLLEPDLAPSNPDEQRAQVLDVYGRVLRGKVVRGDDENPLIATLRLSGACAERNGRIVVRNNLYAAAFDDEWRRSSLPDAERRRQRAAAVRAALLTGSIATVILATIGVLAVRNAALAHEKAGLLERAQRLNKQVEYQAYVARMVSLSALAEKQSSGTKMARVFNEASAYPLRGWEWHWWNLLLNSPARILHPGRCGNYWLTQSGLLGGFVSEIPGGATRLWFEGREPSLLLSSSVCRWLPRFALEPQPADAWCRKLLGLAGQLPRDALLSASTPDLSELLFFDPQRRAYVLRTKGGALRDLITVPKRPLNIIGALSADGLLAAVQTTDFSIHCFNAQTGESMWTQPGRNAMDMEFSPDRTWLALACADEKALLYRVGQDGQAFQLVGHTAPSKTVQFSSDGSLLLTASLDGTARLWRVSDQKELRVFGGHRDLLSGATFSPDGRQVVTSDASGEVRLWDLSPASSAQVVVQHPGEAHRIVEGAGGVCFASSNEGALVAFDVDTGHVRARLPSGTLDGDPPLAASPDGRRLATLFADHTLRVIDCATLAERYRWPVGPNPVSAVVYDGEGDRIFVGYNDGSAALFQPGDPKPVRWSPHTKRIRSVAFSRDGAHIATGSEDGFIVVWSTKDLREEGRWNSDATAVTSLEFYDGDREILCADYNGTVTLLSTKTWTSKRLTGHTSRLFRAVFSPDHSRILSYGYDGTLRLWNAFTGKPIATMTHDSWVSAAHFSSDGTRIVSASADKTIRIWDGWTGDEYLQLSGHTEAVFDARFSSDGANIISASNDGTVRIWRSK